MARKMLLEKCNLFQVTKLPSGTFLPYTGVETMILFFKKGEATKIVKFIKLENDYVTEKLIGNVDIQRIMKSNYSLNYKLYVNMNVIDYTNMTYCTIDDMFNLEKGLCGSQKCIEDKNGSAVLINWSLFGNYKKISKGKYFGENLFVSTSLPNGKEKGYMVITYYNGECDCCNLMSNMKIKEEYSTKIILKFYYYYLIFNSKNIEDNYQKGCANKSLDISLFKQMQIPIPPLPIQDLIVKELNSMYKEKENIQKAIDERTTSRKAMFEMLLEECVDKKLVKLGDVCEPIKTGKNKTKDGLGEGKKYPYYGTGGITGYTNEFLIDGDYILTPRNGNVGIIFLCNGKSFPSDHMFIVKPLEEKMGVKFLNYAFLQNNLAFHKTGAIIPNITKEKLDVMKIFLPSKSDQQRIVLEMEKFDTLDELQKAQITRLDDLIKKSFEYHLNKCKKEVMDENKEELDDNVNFENDNLDECFNTRVDEEELIEEKPRKLTKAEKEERHRIKEEKKKKGKNHIEKSKNKT